MLSRLAHNAVVAEPQDAVADTSRPQHRPLHAAAPQTGDAALRVALEQRLKPRAPLLRLPPELERRYQESTWASRSRGTRTWLAVVAGLDLIWIALDAMISCR